MPEPRLAVLVVARNEEKNLVGCLDPPSSPTSGSSWWMPPARTPRWRSPGVWPTWSRSVHSTISQTSAMPRLALASADWVLSIDADERVTPELAAEIRMRLADASNTCVGFRVPIRSEILGRHFGFSGTQHDLPLRLFRRDRGRWAGLVHETVAIVGPVGRMEQFLEHRTMPNIRVFLGKIDHYTTLEACDLDRSGRRFRTSDVALRPIWTFFKLYLGKQGFRDGLEGLMFCALSAVSVAVRSWKLRELCLARRAS